MIKNSYKTKYSSKSNTKPIELIKTQHTMKSKNKSLFNKLKKKVDLSEVFNNKIYNFTVGNKQFKCIHNIDFNELENNENKNRLIDKKIEDISFINKHHTEFYNFDDPQLYYDFEVNDNAINSQYHWGQLKLYLSELQVMVDLCNADEEYVIVYPGSAPGNHLINFLEFFPNIKFDLTDPRPFNEKLIEESEKTNGRIVIQRDKNGSQVVYFNDELAKKIKKTYDDINKQRKKDNLKPLQIIFISDIRLPPDYKKLIKDESIIKYKQYFYEYTASNTKIKYLKNLTIDYLQGDKGNVLIDPNDLKIDVIDKITKEHYKKYANEIYKYELGQIQNERTKIHLSIFDVKKNKITFNFEKYKNLELKDQLVLAQAILWNEAIFHDLSIQESWVKKIKPEYTLLKFRFPFGYNMKFKHLDGDIYWPIYGPKHTTESRLLIIKDKHKFKSINWDTLKYERQLAYFNLVTRKQYYPHKYDNLINIDHCYDCISHIKIWEKYFKKYYMFIRKFKNNNSFKQKMNNNNSLSEIKTEFIETSIKKLIYDLTIEQFKYSMHPMNVYINKGKGKSKKFDELYSSQDNIISQIGKLKNYIQKYKLHSNNNDKLINKTKS